MNLFVFFLKFTIYRLPYYKFRILHDNVLKVSFPKLTNKKKCKPIFLKAISITLKFYIYIHINECNVHLMIFFPILYFLLYTSKYTISAYTITFYDMIDEFTSFSPKVR